MSSSRLLTALVILTLAVCAEQARATSMLMVKDGYSLNNIARAQSLGHAVTEEWLEAIEQMSQAELAPLRRCVCEPAPEHGNIQYAAFCGG
jgi:hypothetical protein